MNQLHPIAQAVQSQGRGNDTQLVHMTPNEVQGLQALAKAHGGSLSINPSTGLPEAGFLDSLLPTILGAGLAAATGGSSLMIGAGLGALQYARTGSLEKGLMAGLGAYGGAGLGASLMGAGATAGSGAMTNLAAEQAKQQAAAAAAKTVAEREAAQLAAKKAAEELALQQANTLGANTFSQNLSNMGTGLKTAFSSPTTFMNQFGGSGMDLAKSAGAAAAPMLMQQPQTTTPPSDNEQYQYTYNPNRASEEDLAAQRAANPQGELRYFNPQYQGPRMVRVAQGGELDYAGGGTIDLSGTINLGGQGAQGGLGAGRPNNSFAEGPAGGLGAMLGGLNRGIEGLFGGSPMSPASGNPMMLSNAQYDGRALPRRQTYEQYLAGRSPIQQDVQLTREQFERANNASFGDPGAMSYGSSPNSMFAEGGAVDYEYDPVTQTYKKKTSAPIGAVPAIGVPGSGGGSGGDGAQPLSKQTIDFLEKEDKSPGGARDQRMGKINDILAMLAPGAMARALVGGANSLTGGGIGQTRAPVFTVDTSGTGVTSSGASASDNMGGSVTQYSEDPAQTAANQAAAEAGGYPTLAQGGALRYENGGPIGAVEPIGIRGNRPMDAGYFKDMAGNAAKNYVIERGLGLLGVSPQLAALGMAGKGIYNFFNPDQPPAPVVSGSSFPSVPGQNPSGDSGGNGGYTVGDGTQGSASMSDYGGEADLAKGGLLALAAGGMSKGGFVIPADVVSALGNGSTDAGLRTLQAKMGAVKPIKGQGDGLSDSIKTSIDGKQPARVADGEAYIPPETVAKMGGGDPKKGAKKLYAMMDKIRQQAHGKTSQQRKVSPDKVV